MAVCTKTHAFMPHTVLTAICPGKPGLADCPLKQWVLGEFYGPDGFPGSNQQKCTALQLFCIHNDSRMGRNVIPSCCFSHNTTKKSTDKTKRNKIYHNLLIKLKHNTSYNRRVNKKLQQCLVLTYASTKARQVGLEILLCL